MDILTLLFNEFKLLLKSWLTRIFIALVSIFTAFGLNSINNSNAMSLHGIQKTSLTMALGSAKYGALAGSLLFAMLTLIFLSKDRRKDSLKLLESSRDYYSITIMRIVSLLICGVLSTLSGMVLTFMIQHFIFHVPFDIGIYGLSYGTVMLPSIIFTILLCTGFYLIFESIDVGFLLFGALFIMGITSDNYLLNWVQTSVEVYSDFGGIGPVSKLILYNRLLWIFISASILLSGTALRRRYEYGIPRSFKINIKNHLLPGVLVLAIAATAFLYVNEPFVYKNDSVFNSNIDYSEGIILRSIKPHVSLYPEEGSMSAKVLYEFNNKSRIGTIDFITNAGFEIDSLLVNGNPSSWESIENTDMIRIPLTESENSVIEISYRGSLKYPGAAGFPGYISSESIYLLENSHWVFEPMSGQADTVEVTGWLEAPSGLTVVTPGKLVDVKNDGNTSVWNYTLKSPNPQLGVFASHYKSRVIMAGGTTVEFYYSPKHENYIDTMKIDGYIKRAVEYYTDKLGPYPFEEYPLKIVETSIYKPGGHSTFNVVTLAEYILNREETGSPVSYTLLHDVNIIAHEIAHQWWGSGVIFDKEDWLSEGLVEYMAFKYVEELFGTPLARFISDGWRNSANGYFNNYYVRNPEAINSLQKDLRQKIKSQIAKVQAYAQTPLCLLESEKAAGQEAFYGKLSKVYRNHLHKSLGYDEFLSYMNLEKEAFSIEQP